MRSLRNPPPREASAANARVSGRAIKLLHALNAAEFDPWTLVDADTTGQVTPMRNEHIGLWEVERYGSDSFVDVDYVCV